MPTLVAELHSGALLTSRFFKSLSLGFSVGDTHEEKAAYASGQRRIVPGMKVIGESDEARAAELLDHDWKQLAPTAQRVLEKVVSAVQGNCNPIETSVVDGELAVNHRVINDTSDTAASADGISRQDQVNELEGKKLSNVLAPVEVDEGGNPGSSPENNGAQSTVERVLRDVYERERRGSLEKCVSACMFCMMCNMDVSLCAGVENASKE